MAGIRIEPMAATVAVPGAGYGCKEQGCHHCHVPKSTVNRPDDAVRQVDQALGNAALSMIAPASTNKGW